MAEIYFHTTDLAVGYNGKALIHDINFAIEKGEIVTLIGPNGSGKSTILKSITRQLKTIAGSVFIHTGTKGLMASVTAVENMPSTAVQSTACAEAWAALSFSPAPMA